MNQKEMLSKEDNIDKVDEGYYKIFIGCLMYLIATRPDILFPISILSRFLYCASEMHLKETRRILRCIKSTIDCGVVYVVRSSSCVVSLIVIGHDPLMT